MSKDLNEIKNELNDRLKDHEDKLKLNKEKKQALAEEIKKISMEYFRFIFSQQVKLLREVTKIENNLNSNINSLMTKENELLQKLKCSCTGNDEIINDYNKLELLNLKIDFNFEFKKNEIIEKYLIIGDLLDIESSKDEKHENYEQMLTSPKVVSNEELNEKNFIKNDADTQKKYTKNNKIKNSYTNSTIGYLNKQFLKNHRPNHKEIKRIASHTILNCKQIKVWFLNKRLKHKKLKKKSKSKAEKILLNEFKKNQYLDRFRITKLMQATYWSRQLIYDWFTNRRLYYNKISKKKVPETLSKLSDNNNDKNQETKKTRVKISDIDLKILNDEFQKNMFPSTYDIIASKVSLAKEQVIAWFSNKRYNFHRIEIKRGIRDKQILDILNKEYEKNKYPNREALDRIAKMANLSTKQVYDWFARKRIRLNQINPDRFSEKRLSVKEREYLYKQFEINCDPEKEAIQAIASELNTSPEKIYHWFRNKKKFIL